MPNPHIVTEESIFLLYQMEHGGEKFHLVLLRAWKSAPFEAGLARRCNESLLGYSKFLLELSQLFGVAVCGVHGEEMTIAGFTLFQGAAGEVTNVTR